MVWKSRNDLKWKHRSMKVDEVVQSAKSILNQWLSVQDKTSDHFMAYMTHDGGYKRWKLQINNGVKININAAIFDSTNCYSYAFVVRNHTGILVETYLRCLPGSISPNVAEALSIIEALSWMKD